VRYQWLFVTVLLLAAPARSVASSHPSNAEMDELARSLAQRSHEAIADHEALQIKANEGCQPNLILCGQDIDSNLTTSSCPTPAGFADEWYFPNYTPQAIGTSVVPRDFDVTYTLFDPDHQIVRETQAFAGGIADFGAYLHTFGNFNLQVSTQATSRTKTGSYRIGLACGNIYPPCDPDVATLCLNNGRFRVQAAWHNQFNNTYGFGRAISSTDEAGFFSFGDPDNIELLVKVLKFGDVYKVFYGELTNLKFTIAVSDMYNFLQYTKSYSNSSGDCGGIDQSLLAGEKATTYSGGCNADSHTLCLLNGRFAVTMDWRNQYNGASGTGGAVPLSDVTGAFYFTEESNLELMAKVLDLGDRIAVFFGALSDLEYDLTVRDLATAAQKTYHNAGGHYCGGLDNSAFPK
jgi:hypothetical protein